MSLIYGKQFPRELLKFIHTPEPEGKHFPICHNYFLELLEKALIDAGFKIHKNEVVLSQKFPSPELLKQAVCQFENEGTIPEFSPEIGARAFGGLSITREDLVGKERQLVCGWRNSHDKIFRSAVCIGSQMMVCDNLCFSSEREVGRKHTRNILRDLPSVISQIVHGLVAEWMSMEQRIRAYKLVPLTREQGADLCMKLREHGAIAPTKIAKVWDYWFEPATAAKTMIDKLSFIDEETDEYDEESYNTAISEKGHELEAAFGKASNLWGLYNAFTQTLKGSDFSKLPARTMAAQALFDTIAGIDVKVNSKFDGEKTENGIDYEVETTTEVFEEEEETVEW